jgi:hypothetical protein
MTPEHRAAEEAVIDAAYHLSIVRMLQMIRPCTDETVETFKSALDRLDEALSKLNEFPDEGVS